MANPYEKLKHLTWKNPELRRSSWKEFSRTRLILLPLIAVVAILYFVLGNEGMNLRLDGTRAAAITVFGLCTFLIGAIFSSISVNKEIKERTWNNQRLTLLSPSQMAVGKWLGPSLFTWAVAFMCIVIYVAVSAARAHFEQALWFALLMVLFAGILQILAGALGISMLRRYPGIRFGAYIPLIPLLMMSIGLLSDLMPQLHAYKATEKDIEWWGMHVAQLPMFCAAAALMLFSLFFWYRSSMAREMNYKLNAWWMHGVYPLLFAANLAMMMGFMEIATLGFTWGVALCVFMSYWFVLSAGHNQIVEISLQPRGGLWRFWLHRPLLDSVVFTGLFLGVSAWLRYPEMYVLDPNPELEATSLQDYARLAIFWGVSMAGMFFRDAGLYLLIQTKLRIRQPEMLWLALVSVLNFLVAPILEKVLYKNWSLFIFPSQIDITPDVAFSTLGLGIGVLLLAHFVNLKR